MMDTTLKLWFFDGQEDRSFPYGMRQAELGDFTVSKTRMGSAPTITGTLEYPVCLDDEWERNGHFDDVYVVFNNERYYLKATPASSKSNDKAFYRHELGFVSERVVLETVYMVDDNENQTADILYSNNTQYTFFGNVHDFAERINQSMYFSGIGDTCMYSGTPPVIVPISQRVLAGDGYYVVVDASVTNTDEVLVTLSDSTVSDALRQVFEKWGVPYYFVGKVIHVGDYEAVTETTPTYADGGVLGAGLSGGALVPYEYGHPNAVLTVSRNNGTKAIYNRCSGTGSEDNIPYYYPNPTPKGFISVEADAGNAVLETADLLVDDLLLFSQKMGVNSECEYKGDYSSINLSNNTMTFPARTSYDNGNTWSNGQLYFTLPTNIEVSSQDYYDLDLDARYYDFTTGRFVGVGANMDFRNTLRISIPEGQLPSETYTVPLGSLTRCVVKNVGKYVNGVFVSGQFESDKYLFSSDNYRFFATDNFAYNILLTYYIPRTIFEWAMSNSPDGNHIHVSLDTGFNALHLWAIDGETNRINFVTLADIGISLDAGVTPAVGDKFYQRLDKYIHPQQKLMPSCYRASDGTKRFYPARNYPMQYVSGNNYEIDPDLGDEVTNDTLENDNYKESGTYLAFANPHRKMRQKEHIYDMPDIKPTIEGMENGHSQRIDMFADVAFDTNDDNGGVYDENGNFIYDHPYFFVKLRATDGSNGFNIFDQAIDEGEMTIALTSGDCAPCEFVIGVDDETKKNTVQVDTYGNLKRNTYGDVICGRGEGSNPQEAQSPQAQQNDTRNNEVWIALKKDTDTYGELMPFNDGSTIIRPKACTSSTDDDGDTFVILHIDMPLAYVTAAEERLTREIIKQMNADNSEKFNMSLKYSRVYLGDNQRLADLLDENVKVYASYNGTAKQYFVSSYSYAMKSSSPIPEITIGGLVETVEELKSVASGGGLAKSVANQISERFGELMAGFNRPFTRIIKQNNTNVANQIKGDFPTDYVRTSDELAQNAVIIGAGARHVRRLMDGSDGQVLMLQDGKPAWGDAPKGVDVTELVLSNDMTVPSVSSAAVSDLTFTATEDGLYLFFAQLQFDALSNATTTFLAYLSTDKGKNALASGRSEITGHRQICLFGLAELENGDSVEVYVKGDTANAMSVVATAYGYANATTVKVLKVG